MKKRKVILSVSIIIVALLLILGGNALRNNLTDNNKSSDVSKKVAAVNKESKNKTKETPDSSVTKAETKESSDSKVAKENQSADKGKETAASTKVSSTNQKSSTTTNQSVSSNDAATPAPSPQKPAEEPNLTVVDALSNKTIFSAYVDVSGKTVGDVTLNSLMSKGISVESTGSGYSLYISAIAGIREKEHGKNSGWIYFVNGNSPQVGCGSYKLNKDDKVVWKYSSN